jgi:hypothetical protein
LTRQEIEALVRNIQKANEIDTALGGQLTAQQAKKFIQTVKDEAWLFNKVSFQPMKASTYHMDAIAVAARQMQAAVEHTAPTDLVAATMPRRTLNTVEVIYPYDITFNFLEENIEGGNAEASINQAFAKAFANDLLDLATNGDGVTGTFLIILTGWIQTALADGSAHVVTGLNSSTDYIGTVFPALLDAMPDKWKTNPSQVPILCSIAKARAYARDVIADRQDIGDKLLTTGQIPTFEGHPVVGVPSWGTNYFMVTPYKNLYVGLGRSMRVGRQVQERPRLIEYTLTAKVDADYAVSDAVVVADHTDNT